MSTTMRRLTVSQATLIMRHHGAINNVLRKSQRRRKFAGRRRLRFDEYHHHGSIPFYLKIHSRLALIRMAIQFCLTFIHRYRLRHRNFQARQNMFITLNTTMKLILKNGGYPQSPQVTLATGLNGQTAFTHQKYQPCIRSLPNASFMGRAWKPLRMHRLANVSLVRITQFMCIHLRS